MQSFTTEQVIEFATYATPASLVVQANGGSVQVDVLLDTDSDTWINHDTYDADGIYKIEANGLTIRFTPADGAVFAVVRPAAARVTG